MKTCENCGSRVYSLGCTWCNEEADIEHDVPEHAPTYRGETLVCVAGVVLTTPERACELLEDAA